MVAVPSINSAVIQHTFKNTQKMHKNMLFLSETSIIPEVLLSQLTMPSQLITLSEATLVEVQLDRGTAVGSPKPQPQPRLMAS